MWSVFLFFVLFSNKETVKKELSIIVEHFGESESLPPPFHL